MPDEMASEQDGQAKSQVDFLWKVHDYLGDNIKFSDTKAAFLVAFASGLIASLVTHDFTIALHPWNAAKPVERIIVALAYIGFPALAISVSLAMLSVLPRLWNNSKKKSTISQTLLSPFDWICRVFFPGRSERSLQPIFWEHITAYKDEGSYFDFVHQMSYSDQVEAIGKTVYTRAAICQRKFRLVNASTFFVLLGAIVAAILIAFFSIK